MASPGDTKKPIRHRVTIDVSPEEQARWARVHGDIPLARWLRRLARQECERAEELEALKRRLTGQEEQ